MTRSAPTIAATCSLEGEKSWGSVPIGMSDRTAAPSPPAHSTIDAVTSVRIDVVAMTAGTSAAGEAPGALATADAGTAASAVVALPPSLPASVPPDEQAARAATRRPAEPAIVRARMRMSSTVVNLTIIVK